MWAWMAAPLTRSFCGRLGAQLMAVTQGLLAVYARLRHLRASGDDAVVAPPLARLAQAVADMNAGAEPLFVPLAPPLF